MNKKDRNKKGKFIKGNPGKRPGTKNKKTRDWEEMRDHIKNELVPIYVEKVKTLIDSPEAKKNLIGMDKLLNILEYFAPKLSRAEVQNEGGQTLRIIHEEMNGTKD